MRGRRAPPTAIAIPNAAGEPDPRGRPPRGRRRDERAADARPERRAERRPTSWSAEVAAPSRPGGASRRTISDSAEYARPMPKPGDAPGRDRRTTGTPGSRMQPRPAMPDRHDERAHARRTAAGPSARYRRAWIHDPAVHESVAAVIAIPATAADRPRQPCERERRRRRRRAKNANVSDAAQQDRRRQAARQRAACRAGSGAGTRASRAATPTTTSGTTSSAAPARSGRRSEQPGADGERRSRSGSVAASGAGRRRSPLVGRCGRDATQAAERDRRRDTAMSGSRPRKTQRQSNASATTPASAGPRTPGRTQAVESIANICGRRRSGMLRPIAT